MWHNLQDEFSKAAVDSTKAAPQGVIDGCGRFNIYRNNIAVSLSGALGETFPVVKQLVGEAFFVAMARDYVQKNQPASPVLSEYGSTFSDFIETFLPAKELPYLSDVARLERNWLDAYHAQDHMPLNIDVLASVPDAEMEGLTLTFHPSVRLIESGFPVVSIWQAHQQKGDADLSDLPADGECALIIRPAMNVIIVPLSKSAHDFFRMLIAGGTLGEACDRLAGNDAFDPPAHLAQLFQAGAVIALNHSGTNGEGTAP